MSALEDQLAWQLATLDLPPPEREYRWAARLVGEGKGLRGRLAAAGLKDWRYDFAWPAQRLAVEVEGGAWVGGRHTRGAGFTADIAKYHAALSHGWTVYRCDARLVRTGEAARLVRVLLDRLDFRI